MSQEEDIRVGDIVRLRRKDDNRWPHYQGNPYDITWEVVGLTYDYQRPIAKIRNLDDPSITTKAFGGVGGSVSCRYLRKDEFLSATNHAARSEECSK